LYWCVLGPGLLSSPLILFPSPVRAWCVCLPCSFACCTSGSFACCASCVVPFHLPWACLPFLPPHCLSSRLSSDARLVSPFARPRPLLFPCCLLPSGSFVLGLLFWVFCSGSFVLGLLFWVFCSGSFVLGLLFWVFCSAFLRVSTFSSPGCPYSCRRGFPAPSLLAVRSFPPSVFAPAVLSRVLGCFSGPRAFSPAFLVYLVPSVLLPPLFPPRCLLSFSSPAGVFCPPVFCPPSRCSFLPLLRPLPSFFFPFPSFACVCFACVFLPAFVLSPASCPTVVPAFVVSPPSLSPLLPALWPSLTVVVALLALPVEAGFLFASSFF
jgi:hypothetical protein